MERRGLCPQTLWFRAPKRERVCRKSRELGVGMWVPQGHLGQLCTRQLMSGSKVLDSSLDWAGNLGAVWE